ncbi:MAG: HD domain-containing protein [Spirochaetes bacterium]|nr:HD domain-containing protein [Spirochaetota bacterium]
MSDADEYGHLEEAVELEDLEESPAPPRREPALLDSPEYQVWTRCSLGDRVPSLFLDRSLRILRANESFCKMFGCNSQFPGLYFTQFYAAFFDPKKSAELFRAVLSPKTGYTWNGRVEKLGMDQLLNVSKIWILPLFAPGGDASGGAAAASGAPEAYSAMCLDMTTEYRDLLQNTFMSLLGAARLKDNDTGNHIERVNRYARILAEDLGGRRDSPEVDRQFIASIGLVAALHDVGKIGTPDDILNKAGPLETWEWDVMKQHTTNGAYILSTYPNPMAREVALRHHERWDGSGYPHGLSQDLIPLSARIVAVADVYDALRMRRTYKEAYSHERALETMEREKGTHFDPRLIERFLSVADDFRTVFSDLADAQ